MRTARVDLADCSALVTGASSGIGQALVAELVSRGCGRVIAVARRAARLQDLVDQHGPAVVPWPADLENGADIKSLIEQHPQVDLLINNAGFGWSGPFVAQASEDPERLLRMVDLNCRAVVALTAAYTPGMAARGRGWVLNVGSVAGMKPAPTMVAYGATKAFVHSFSDALGIELHKDGVRVCTLAPGPVDTEFFFVSHPGREERPISLVFRKPATVAAESLDALFAARSFLIPGTLIRLGARSAAALPMPLFRRLARLATGPMDTWLGAAGQD